VAFKISEEDVMKLCIYDKPCNATTVTANTPEGYLEACKMIESCINRDISVGIATNNKGLANFVQMIINEL
jgi:hypothetical protein